jgi:hypothetical protein
MTKVDLEKALAEFRARGGNVTRVEDGAALGADQISQWASRRAVGQSLPPRKRTME